MKYKQCIRCVMDNISDTYITFDEEGYCNYCSNAIKIKGKVYFPNEKGQKKIQKLINRLKSCRTEYDCIMGISGGLDSSYLAYLGSVKWGLKILAVHIDDGFDTEVSKRNIEKISNFPNFNLKTIKPDAIQFKELTKAFMRAGVPNLAIPQDNVLFAGVYKYLKSNCLKTFLSGSNFALECILQKGNTHSAYDLRNINCINKKFGKGKLNNLNLISDIKKDIDKFIFRIETISPLNFIDYNRTNAMKELEKYCGFEYYGGKHLENELTKFIQQYWFYEKFGVDKRKSHLSSMIVSGQITRDEELKELNKPIYDESEMKNTINSILKKLDLSNHEFNIVMQSKTHQHDEYLISRYRKLKKILSKIISHAN